MQTDRGLDRLTYFTDAIAAIAITLLILPLVDLVPGEKGSPLDFLGGHVNELLAFALSFAVIARLWISHHTLFEHVGAYSGTLRVLSLSWAFTIVLLPLPTAMVAHWKPEPIVVGFYIGTMFVSSALLTAMSVIVQRDPRLQHPENPIPRLRVLSSILTSVEFLVALVLGASVITINYWALFVLVVSTPILVIVRRRSEAGAHA